MYLAIHTMFLYITLHHLLTSHCSCSRTMQSSPPCKAIQVRLWIPCRNIGSWQRPARNAELRILWQVLSGESWRGPWTVMKQQDPQSFHQARDGISHFKQRKQSSQWKLQAEVDVSMCNMFAWECRSWAAWPKHSHSAGQKPAGLKSSTEYVSRRSPVGRATCSWVQIKIATLLLVDDTDRRVSWPFTLIISH